MARPTIVLEYLEDRYLNDKAIDPKKLRMILESAPAGSLDMSIQTEDELPLLHLAAMNEATSAPALAKTIQLLLEAGAPLDLSDGDDDTVLDAILAFSEDGENLSQEMLEAHLAVVHTLLHWPALEVSDEQVASICTWLRRHMTDMELKQPVLEALRAKADPEVFNIAWRSEELLAYLEQCAYEEKRGIEAAKVEELIRSGASVAHSQNGATALLLAVLNPYTQYPEAVKAFRAMLTQEPEVAAIRDGFKLLPLQWAADHRSISSQHGLQRTNPAVLLALFPLVVELLPPGTDAGQVCLKVMPDGSSGSVPPGMKPPQLRFMEGDRVLCLLGAPGATVNWEEGIIVGTWYRESSWPSEFCGAPYEVALDIGQRVYSLVDSDEVVKALKGDAVKVPSPGALQKQVPAAAAPNPASGKPAAAVSGKRFVKRQKEDGKWEILDTVSGRARPSSPPDSDDDD
mmetsp:Transcript_51178/g.121642  ORF Transcript_51178/g.121642 Transcript_51178/m.121642 type:complete len:458 (+) Transcript_51178:121-1494(+)